MFTISDEEMIAEYFGDEHLAKLFIDACDVYFDAVSELDVKSGKYLEVGYLGQPTQIFAAFDRGLQRFYYKKRSDMKKVYLPYVQTHPKPAPPEEHNFPKELSAPEDHSFHKESACTDKQKSQKATQPSSERSKYGILEKYYGYSGFKDGQSDIIDAILGGRDVMCVMPTGAGKSICYQIPALMMDGMSVVISPLISLMKDQVQALRQMGVDAAYLNSSLSMQEYSEVMRGAERGAYKILYVAPERLASESFVRLSRKVRIPMVAIDEAHCISQWGQDFRPDYLQILDYIDALPVRPVIGAFTATATKEVKEDVVNILQLRAPYSITTGFDRPNLTFSVYTPDDKDRYLLSLMKKYDGESGIIYCATRKTVEELCEMLCDAGYKATCYHGGMGKEERRRNQDDFINDRKNIITATNAFGMGIDKPNVSFVIHYNIPKSIENYYQEAGRAGRDGSKADCILLYSARDVATNQFIIGKSEGNPNLTADEQEQVRARELDRLREMTFYANTKDCLRHYILKYFGEWSAPRCENCSNCLKQFKVVDFTDDARAIISCISDTRQRYGVTMIADILKGSNNERIRRLNLDRSASYSRLSGVPAKRIKEEINTLIAEGYLRIEGSDYPIVKTNREALEVLRGAKKLQMKVYGEVEKHVAAGKAAKTAFLSSGSISSELYEKIKNYRLQKAHEKSVPAFVIFSDKTLEDLCRKLPATKLELRLVHGIGESKTKLYGDELLALIKPYAKERESQSTIAARASRDSAAGRTYDGISKSSPGHAGISKSSPGHAGISKSSPDHVHTTDDTFLRMEAMIDTGELKVITSAEEIRTGDTIFHTSYGAGKVIGLKNGKIRINFGINGNREFLLTICLEKRMLYTQTN